VIAGLFAAVPTGVPAEESSPAEAVGEGIRCENVEGDFSEPPAGVERVPHPFGGERALLAVRCRRKAGRRFWSHRLDVSVWEGRERVSGQTLFNEMTGSSGLRYQVDGEVERVRLRYDCGSTEQPSEPGNSKWCRRVWQWSSVYGRFIETSEGLEDRRSERYHLRRFETSLARDEFERAARALRTIADVAGPENADWRMELNWRLLREVARSARPLSSDGEGESSAAMAAEAFTVELPNTYERGKFASESVWFVPTVESRGEGASREWRERGRILLRRDSRSVETVERLADLLGDSEGYRGLAARVLRRAAEAYPERVGLVLQRADVLWAVGRRSEAAGQYRAYLEAVEEGGAPERAEERAEERD